MSQAVALAVLSGLLYGGSLLLASIGLSLIFGVGRVVNFAHGALYALGAFLGASICGVAGLFAACVFVTLVVAACAALLDLVLLRRLRGYGEMSVLLFTFGLGIVIDAAIVAIWRGRSFSVRMPDALSGAFPVFGGEISFYSVFVAALSLAIAGLLIACLHFTDFGLRWRAAAESPPMAEIAAIDVNAAFTVAFALGSGLCALAGALALPLIGASNGMDLPVTALVFIIAIVGGLGSLPGTIVMSVAVGLILTLGATFASSIAYLILFAAVIAMLLIRPFGLLGSRAD
jgi:branched-chain amino acid transport system permease protein